MSAARPVEFALCIGADHPALPGHFPGQPLIPGALLLDETLHAIEQLRGTEAAVVCGWELEAVKFHRAARPAEQLLLSIEANAQAAHTRYAFQISAAGTLIASGRLIAREAVAAPAISERSTPARPRRASRTEDQGWRDRPERGNALLLRGMVAVSLRLGRPVGRLFLYVGAAYFFCFSPRAAQAMRSYLRRALGREPRAIDRMRQIVTFANTIHDRIWLLRRREDLFDITLEGEAAIREAVASGGSFLMGAHMGSFEVLRLVGRRQGFTVAVSMYEAQAQRLNRFLQAIAPMESLQVIPVGRIDSMLRIRDALEAGSLVGVLADRLFGAEPWLPLNFLGAEARFPVNPMRLAAMLRRRVIFMLGLYRGGNRYHVVFEPLADFTQVTAQTRAAAIESAMQRYAQLLERRCRTDPYNWFNFFEFWPAPQDAAPAADTAAASP